MAMHIRGRRSLKLSRKFAVVLSLGGLLVLTGTSSADAASVATWDKVAQCESSGIWKANTGNGYYGGLQISLGTWRAYGGGEYAAYPHQATKKEQILTAEEILAGQGAGAWPTCGRQAGLADDHENPYPEIPAPNPVPEVSVAEPSQRVHADFDGDGRDDVAVLYGYDDHTVSLFTFLAKSDGGFAAPVKSWTSQPNYWTFKSVKMTAGDYDGDGRSELAAMYDYADGSVALFTWPSNADGTFQAPRKSWETAPGNWYPEHVQLASGDFDGNGRDDVAAFYGYSDGRAALFTFKSTTGGGFSAPVKSWNVPEAYWWGEHVKFTSGDFNGDGRTDAAALYGYDDGTVSAFTWIANSSGGFGAPTKSWTVSPGNWTFESVKLTSGDYNGNGRDDLAAMYDYADGSAAMFTWLSDTDGTFLAPRKSWETAPGNWYPEHVQLVSGDYDGNGRDDVAAFYGYDDARAALFTFKSDTTGKFAAPVKSWNVPAKQWWGEHVKLG
ncbi:transglycosylase family protein [Streptomyces flavovirens]|uniref:transglycosylase family protein n=1 Tax=Streptomyces flavovirens TaxID=52258 RepID=UPI003D0F127C